MDFELTNAQQELVERIQSLAFTKFAPRAAGTTAGTRCRLMTSGTSTVRGCCWPTLIGSTADSATAWMVTIPWHSCYWSSTWPW